MEETNISFRRMSCFSSIMAAKSTCALGDILGFACFIFAFFGFLLERLDMIFRFANGDARRIQRLVSPHVSANPAVGGRRAVASSENTAQSPSGLALIITRDTGP
ncbi:hypothetical protein BGW80DRAFT_1282339, partial [Lactifluus volemus]